MTSAVMQALENRADDKMWRIHNLYYIEDVKGNHVQFQPNHVQLDLFKSLHEKNIILKARQHGISTLVAILELDEAIFCPNTHCGIIAHTREDASEIFRSKIKYPYEHLPESVRNTVQAKSDTVNSYIFDNGSTIRVGTSMRSSTLQMLHISEYGKICAAYPEKAREVRTGALNTVHAGQVVIIESTAEGQEGDFFEKCEKSRHQAEMGDNLTSMDYKFHFLPWWEHPDYLLSKEEALRTEIDETHRRYFRRLHEENGVPELSRERMAWYVKKEEEQRDDMKREHPSYAQEAFEQAIEGAIYEKQLAHLRRNDGITDVPHDPRYAVHTAWDIGRRDTNAIWFFQEHPGPSYKFIHYYENSLEPIQHYGNYMAKLAQDNPGWFYGMNYLPHDAKVIDYSQADNKMRSEIIEDMGFRVEVVERIRQDTVSSGEGIQASRDILPMCSFDKEGCKRGLACLGAYQREWKEAMGAYADRPLHNWASHGAKAFEQMARGHVARRVDKNKATTGRRNGSRRTSPNRRSWKTA